MKLLECCKRETDVVSINHMHWYWLFCLPTLLSLVGGGESDDPACGPPASLSLHLTSSSITSAGSSHKSSGDNVVCM